MDQESIIAFHSAVNRENTHERRFELRPIVRNVTEWDSFVTEKIGAFVPNLNSAALNTFTAREVGSVQLLVGMVDEETGIRPS